MRLELLVSDSARYLGDVDELFPKLRGRQTVGKVDGSLLEPNILCKAVEVLSPRRPILIAISSALSVGFRRITVAIVGTGGTLWAGVLS